MYFPALKTAAFITRRVCHRKTIKLQKSGQGSNQECTFRIHMWSPGLGPAKLFKTVQKVLEELHRSQGPQLTPVPDCSGTEELHKAGLPNSSWTTSPLLQDPSSLPWSSSLPWALPPALPGVHFSHRTRAGLGLELSWSHTFLTHAREQKCFRFFLNP